MNLNPQELLKSLITQNTSNPIINNLFQLMQQGKYDEIENFAKNFLKSKGKDFNTEFENLKKNPISYIQNFK